jgi:ribA/ribD-fused uncharacterized protein
MFLKQENETLTDRIVALESYSKRENLIFQGITVTEKENCWAKVKNVMTTNLKLPNEFVDNIQVQRCHRLYENQVKSNKIIVRFLWYPDRERVWKARFNLARSGIILLEDFPPEIQARRALLYPIFKRAGQLKKKCSLSGDKLVIDSVTYTVKNLNALPPDLNPAEIATKRSEDATAFFTEVTPLSNFFRCDIKIENCNYHSVEQYLQLQKAIFAENQFAVSAIRRAKTPFECKKIARSVVVDNNEWLPAAKAAVRTACLAKFTQNINCKNFLMSTGKTALAEASLDKVWGIGMRLSDANVLEKSKWNGQNNLGKILEDIRKHFAD